MKNNKPLIILLLLIVSVPLMGQTRATIYSNQSGDWSQNTTWQGGVVPTDTVDVEIMSGHNITVSTTEEAASITINATDAANYGQLNMATNANLTTTDDLSIHGKLTMSAGVLNVGTSSGDVLEIEGDVIGSDCLLSLSGGTINVRRYVDMVANSSFAMSGGTMNVNSSGGTSGTDIFDVPNGTTFSMSAGTINILNGNLGSGVALKYNPGTSLMTGGTIHIQNLKNYGSITITCSKDLYNLVCDVGSGNVLHINNMSADSDGFEVNDFTISSGTAQLDAGEMMTINGTASLGGDDNFVLAADATAAASVIFGAAPSNSIQVQCYIPGYGVGSNEWHLLSSPVADQAIQPDFVASTPLVGDDFYAWAETTNSWINSKAVSGSWNSGFDADFKEGKAYFVAYESDTTKTFSGIPNVGTFSSGTADMPALSFTPSEGEGWNLVGNPYPSAIDWDLLTRSEDINGAVYVWDGTNGNYVSWNGSAGSLTDGIIPPMQGFFIKAEAAAQSISIDNGARLHAATPFYKKSTTVEETVTDYLLQLRIDGNGRYDETFIHFTAAASDGYDIAFDAYKLFGSEGAPQLYSLIDNQIPASINSLSFHQEKWTVPLYFKNGAAGLYTLTSRGVDGFWGAEIFLEDLFTNKIIQLEEETEYTFSAGPEDPNNRFLLHFYGVSNTEGTAYEDPPPALMYVHEHTLFIKCSSSLPADYQLRIINLSGQTIFSESGHSSSLRRIPFNFNKGVYIVSLQVGKQLIRQKIWIP